jgi:hypothetical protein
MNYSEASKELLNSQLNEWEFCKSGYNSLNSVQTKTFNFNDIIIKVQFNPGRLVSTSAKVDEKSVNNRKCFLCKQNLPEEQRELNWKHDYIILVNPFPIFPEHFTIPSIHHKPQQIKGNIEIFLELSKDLGEHYTVFYNGPKCGASAPDHIHFQAGEKNFIPIDYQYESIRSRYGKLVNDKNGVNLFSIDDGLRKFLAFESNTDKALSKSLNEFLNIYSNGLDNEPMMNILSDCNNSKWRVIVFLRKKHRPSYYFEEGEKQIMLSPASVDVGGVCITPLQKDFEKIDTCIIKQIFSEVFISTEELNELCRKLE